MSYTVSRIDIAPIPGVHGGSGFHQSTNWIVDPGSVPGSGPLVFTGFDASVTTLLFALPDAVVPNWFGVAVPSGLTDFSNVHLFFHPTPAQANYSDADYPAKTGKWPELFYYMERLGYQLDAARRGQILIMPFMTEASKDAGILPASWLDIFDQIVQQTRAVLAPADTSPPAVNQLAVSSFSAGIIYSDAFRRHGADLDGRLAEVWDFDGRFSSYHAISEALHSTAGIDVIKYDQVSSADTSAFHVPLGRWAQLVNPPTSAMDVHSLIRDFMFTDGASISGVGALIAPGDPGSHTAATHTATHAITATHTGSATQTAAGTGTATHTSSASASHSATHSGTASHSATGSVSGSHSAAHTGTGTISATASHTATGSVSASHTSGPAAPHPLATPGPTAPGQRTLPAPPMPPIVAPAQPAPAAGPTPVTPAGPVPSAASVAPAAPGEIPASALPPAAPCQAAVTAIVGLSATNATVAITAITAIAARRRR